MFVHIQIAYTHICIYVFSISISIYKCVSWRNHESGQMNLPENHNLEFLLYFGEFCSVEISTRPGIFKSQDNHIQVG